MSMLVALPKRGPGRPSARSAALCDAKVREFCGALLELQSGLDFKASARGWCYMLEPYGLAKGDFDKAEKLINGCRKNGSLPLDFTAEVRAITDGDMGDMDMEEMDGEMDGEMETDDSEE